MKLEEKISMLEEMLELDEGTLKISTNLSEIEEWDSMAKLSLIVLLDDEFDRSISGEDINRLVKIQDILDYMQ